MYYFFRQGEISYIRLLQFVSTEHQTHRMELSHRDGHQSMGRVPHGLDFVFALSCANKELSEGDKTAI